MTIRTTFTTPCARALAAATLLLAAGCFQNANPGEDASPEGIVEYDVTGGKGGDDALLTGTLAVADGCVYIDEPIEEQRWMPVFPKGSAEWSGDVLTFRGDDYRVGEEISLGGGVLREDASTAQFEAPKQCQDADKWRVANY